MAKTALILTRPAPSAKRFLAALSDEARAAVTPIVSPLIDIVPLDTEVDLEGVAAVIFTSANGVHYAPVGRGRRAFCVGQKTMDAAIRKEWRAEFGGRTADELIATIKALPGIGRLLHLSGTHRRGNVEERLGKAGLQINTREIYDQPLRALNEKARIALRGPAIVPLFSPRTAQQLASEADDLSNAIVVALSPAVAEPLKDRTTKALHVLEAPTGGDMVDFVEKLCLRTSLP